MKVIDIIKSSKKSLFSFEILPPMKGKGLDTVCSFIDPLMEFKPSFINITSHREQIDSNNQRVRLRPGTVAISASIQHKYDIEVVPHILCGGFTRKETEYVLIDLNFLGIQNILALRGDQMKVETEYKPEPDGNEVASQLVTQAMEMNKGKYLDDAEPQTSAMTNFCCGVAGYPEKHSDAVSFDTDIQNLKKKVDAGADYIITQMFFDNQVYFNFVRKCREAGIDVPIVPGIKPLAQKNQIEILPKLFSIDFPLDLKNAMNACKDDEAARQVGTEWCITQAKELQKHNVPSIHLFTYGIVKQAGDVCRQLF
jgi:methylenetetrahydrofolate reductase (NADPH)